MKKAWLAGFLLPFLACAAGAQQIANGAETDGYQLPKLNISKLPIAQLNINRSIEIVDGQNASDCSQGGGTTVVFCASQVNSAGIASWVAVGGGSASVNGQDITPRSVSATTSVTGKQIGGLFQADQFAGATADVKINACILAAIAAGTGTCDARNLGGAQTIAASISF